MPLKTLHSTLIFTLALVLASSVYAQKKPIDPLPVGGQREFKRLFEQEVNYPPNAINKDIGGRMIILVDIDTTGKVLAMKTKESIGKEVDAEAYRIAKLLLWEPAMHNGKALDGTAELKFKFNPYKFETIVMDRGYRDAKYPKKSTMVVFEPEEVDEEPKIQEKYESFEEYVAKELIFPEAAKTKQVNGYVKVSFVVEPNGRVSNVKVIEALEGNCDVVALDLIHQSRWIPATQAGIPVRCTREEQLGFFSLNPNKNLFHSGEQTPNR